mmetsp:Transcript_30353/g.49411  ORF Transcript_30353/g.49411 Transcript_30353/m.49411 type:complete len:232 (-) Transcript_30353:500-1195(-)
MEFIMVPRGLPLHELRLKYSTTDDDTSPITDTASLLDQTSGSINPPNQTLHHYISTENISMFLCQFGDVCVRMAELHFLDDYDRKLRLLIAAYLHQSQMECLRRIPHDLRTLCVQYYDEPEYKHVNLALLLFKRYATSTNSGDWRCSFSGSDLQKFISELSNRTETQSLAVCNKWLSLDIVHLVSCTTTFSAYYDKSFSNLSDTQETFTASRNYTYRLAPKFCKVFADFVA